MIDVHKSGRLNIDQSSLFLSFLLSIVQQVNHLITNWYVYDHFPEDFT